MTRIDVKGTPVANLWNFRQLCPTFPDVGKRYALRGELSRTPQDGDEKP